MSDSGVGTVQVDGKTLQASWVYSYVQIYLDSVGFKGRSTVPGFREDNEWTITVREDDFESVPTPVTGKQVGLQVGNWPEAAVYFKDCFRNDGKRTVSFRYTTNQSF